MKKENAPLPFRSRYGVEARLCHGGSGGGARVWKGGGGRKIWERRARVRAGVRGLGDYS